jgi:hypothetical protein
MKSIKDAMYPEDFETEDEHFERLCRWLCKFPLKKRMKIGYSHTIATIKLSKARIVRNDRPD